MKKLKNILVFSIFSAIILSLGINTKTVQAFTEFRIIFRPVDRFYDIFQYYLDKGEKSGFDCFFLEEEIDYVKDKIDYYDDKIDETVEQDKIDRYRLNQRSYQRLLSKYRDYKTSCIDGGSLPPQAKDHFVTKNNDYTDIRFTITDRQDHNARINYLLSEEDDSSLTGTFVVTDQIIDYPYNLTGFEKYPVTLRSDEEQSLYLEKPYQDYKNYYFYFFTNFTNSDNYFTTAPYITKQNTSEILFDDIGDSEYKDNIEAAAAIGFIKGYDDGTFRPSGKILRKEFLKIVFLAGNIELSGDFEDLKFADLADESWSLPYINTAVLLNIISSENKNFYPNRDVSYIEAIKIISHVFDLEIPNNKNEVSGLPADHWGVPLINYFEENNFIPESVNDFNLPITREEAVEMIMRVREESM